MGVGWSLFPVIARVAPYPSVAWSRIGRAKLEVLKQKNSDKGIRPRGLKGLRGGGVAHGADVVDIVVGQDGAAGAELRRREEVGGGRETVRQAGRAGA